MIRKIDNCDKEIYIEMADEFYHSSAVTHPVPRENFEKAFDHMSDELQQGKDAVSIFLLKQPCYGGYSDRDGGNLPDHIKVTVSFGGDKPPKKRGNSTK